MLGDWFLCCEYMLVKNSVTVCTLEPCKSASVHERKHFAYIFHKIMNNKLLKQIRLYVILLGEYISKGP